MQRLKTPDSGQKIYRDDTVRGFGVRVSQAGGKSFVVMHGARRKLTTLGKYPALSLKDARQKALQVLANSDEAETDDRAGQGTVKAVSMSEALDAYLAECEVKNKPRTVACYRRHLNKHLPKGKLEAITRREMMGRIGKLANVPGEQAHAFTALKVFFNWCLKHGYLESHPLIGITGVGRIQARERFLDEEELRIVWEKAYSERSVMADIVALCLLTGQRRGEIAKLRWEDIDDDAITLPADITKNGREHRFPYGPLTRRIIERVPGDAIRLFPGRSGGVFNGWSKAKREFGPNGVAHWQLHDLRRTFATMQAKQGTPVHVIERMLNHTSGSFAGVAGIYNRYDYFEEMAAAQLVWERLLDQLIDAEIDSRGGTALEHKNKVYQKLAQKYKCRTGSPSHEQ